MDNKEFGLQLEKRTKQFAISILKLTAQLPDITEAKVVRYQLAKAGTSVGANYREANRSRSKLDFKNKISICETEASESGYWLEIIDEMNWLPMEAIIPVLKEAEELLAIFTSAGNKL
jgi:four helix bundle protein